MKIQKRQFVVISGIIIILCLSFFSAFSGIQLKHSYAAAAVVESARNWTGGPTQNYSSSDLLSIPISGLVAGNQLVIVEGFEDTSGITTVLNDTMSNTFVGIVSEGGSGTSEAVAISSVVSIRSSGSDTIHVYISGGGSPSFITATVTELSGTNVSSAAAFTSFGNGGNLAATCVVSSLLVPANYITFEGCQVPDSFEFAFTPTSGFSTLNTGVALNDNTCGNVVASTNRCDFTSAYAILGSTTTSTFAMPYIFSEGHNTEVVAAFPPLTGGCSIYACVTSTYSISWTNATCISGSGVTCTTTHSFTIVSYDDTSTNVSIIYCDSQTGCVHFTQSANNTVTYTDTSVSLVTSTVTTTLTSTVYNAPTTDSFQFWGIPLMFNFILAFSFLVPAMALKANSSFLYALLFFTGLLFGGIIGLMAHITPWYDPVLCGLVLAAVIVFRAL